MKTKILFLLALFISLFQMPQALAGSNWVHLMELSTDLYQGAKFYLGLEVENGYPKGFYFSNPSGSTPEDKWKTFSLNTLKKPQAIITQLGMNFAKIGFQNATVSFSYKDDFRFGDWHTEYLNLECNSNFSKCALIDSKTKRYVTQGYVKVATSSTWGTVGIESVKVY